MTAVPYRGCVLAVTRLDAGARDDLDGAAVVPAAVGAVLAALADQPGFRHGQVARSLDDDARWVLVTEWESVGSYRRGLSAYDVKIAFADLLPFVVNEPSAYDVVTTTRSDARAAPDSE